MPPKRGNVVGYDVARMMFQFTMLTPDNGSVAMLTMITTCRLNDVDPKALLADVFARIADLPASRLHELLPWQWKLQRQADKPADQQVA